MTDKIRRLKSFEFATAVDWAAQEGWNPGFSDADAFFNTDPLGFWGAFDKQGLAAVISAVHYNSDYGFVGFYICRPDRRGEGLGLRLWETVLGEAVAKTIGLDGVVDQQENYRKSGFELAHRNLRFSGVVTASSPQTDGLYELLINDIAIIDAFEQTCNLFPESRIEFLRGWISTEKHTALALHGPMGLRGYGVIRPCRIGHKVGPLFADNIDDARSLFHALLATRKDQDQPVYLDIPDGNDAARALVEEHGMQAEFGTARMYRGKAPELNLGMTFGITSFELG
ncbi:GNAT family N-acetyltransferase [Thalassospiraceae bacterium SW-3-3]|nr:GNAT family N-acetyltransferase [Thalassospiraceae bacterium SW-3-3]